MSTLNKKPKLLVPSPRSLWNAFFSNEAFPSFFDEKTPSANITEDENSYEVSLAIPGLEKENLNINIEGDQLLVSSENTSSTKDTGQNYLWQEYNYSSFKRSFMLPGNVEKSTVDANYENGVLKIFLGKKEKETQETVSIPVK